MMRHRMLVGLVRMVPSVRVSLLAAATLLTATLAAAASMMSIGPGGRIAIVSEPPAAWISVAGVVAIFAGMLLAVWLYNRRHSRRVRLSTCRDEVEWEHQVLSPRL